jgi:hypothetical protein
MVSENWPKDVILRCAQDHVSYTVATGNVINASPQILRCAQDDM